MKKKYLLVISILVLIFFIFHSINFRIDASSDTLVAQNDEDYKFFTSYNDIFPSRNFLVLAIKSDKEIDDKLKDEIKQIVISHPKVDGFHDFKTRQSGSSQGKFFMQMHIEINEHTSLNESHNIVDQVEEQILKEFPDAEVILHVDPNNIVEKKVWND